MNFDSTIHGYLIDGEALCTHCAPDNIDDLRGWGTASALFGYNASEYYPDGLACSECGEWVFEPAEPVEEAGEQPVLNMLNLGELEDCENCPLKEVCSTIYQSITTHDSEDTAEEDGARLQVFKEFINSLDFEL